MARKLSDSQQAKQTELVEKLQLDQFRAEFP